MQVRHLSEEFIKQSKEKLLKKQQELQEEINLLKSEDPYMDLDRDVDNANLMDEAIQEDLVNSNIEDRVAELEKSLDLVEKALEKIEEGTYGIDEETGDPIDMARLEFYPEALTSADE